MATVVGIKKRNFFNDTCFNHLWTFSAM